MKIYGEVSTHIVQSQNRDPLLRYLTYMITKLAIRYVQNGGKILDLGCGIGRTSVSLAKAGYDVTGLDVSEKAVNIARQIHKNGVAGSLHFIVGDETEPLSQKFNERFDGVVCSEVIEHVEDYQSLLAVCRSVLKEGGFLILTTPNDPAQWTVLDDYAGHLRRFEPRPLEEKLKSSDFVVAESFTVGFPFMRLLLKLYDYYIRKSRKKHDFKMYGRSVTYQLIYIPLATLLLRVDSLFGWSKRGTTIVLVAQKR
ncbi:MAG TPA: methyltransferase domain-containing protein [Anaerolineae bacterium]|nr:methyltransferase domain-containing protein [Anaerolineae bacterium]